MKELNRKVFNTIFILLSLFMFLGIFIYNISSYLKEYENVKRNISFMVDRSNRPEPKEFDNSVLNAKDRELENMMIMDYEIYTIQMDDNEIERIINHSNISSDFNIGKAIKKITRGRKGFYIGNLYNNHYSYYYDSDMIVILNTNTINDQLLFTLVKSLIILFLLEVLVFYFSKTLTKGITRPAQESFDKQRDFIADASHELKTPLAIIMASSDELKSDKKNKKYIDNIKYESDRMSTLIKSLLDLSKLEKGVSIDNYKDENLSKIIERISLTFEGIAFEKNVEIETDIEKDIIFKCSMEEIEKLISIILDNAIKHSEKNSTIMVHLKKDRNNINISITNTGEPIAEGEEEKIFERFYRTDKSRNRDANRYGLGLAIAKNIVTNHNGTIKAFSKDGKTTFTIHFKK